MDSLLPVGNDNHESRYMYRDSPELLKHIPAARYLIKKYGSFYEKNLPNDFDFVFLEKALCSFIDMPVSCDIGRSLKMKSIARRLDINPLALYNDANLSF